MRVIVFGATGGSGRAAIRALVSQGHDVTAFVRDVSGLGELAEKVTPVVGDVLAPADVERAAHGHDAAVVALGIRENAMRVRLWGPARTAADVRSRGTRNVVLALQKLGVRRLVVQSTYGVGETRGRLSFAWRCIFALVLKPQIEDTEEQERIVRESDLDWVLVQPVGLNDKAASGHVLASITGDTRSMGVSRESVGQILASAVGSRELARRSIAVSE